MGKIARTRSARGGLPEHHGPLRSRSRSRCSGRRSHAEKQDSKKVERKGSSLSFRLFQEENLLSNRNPNPTRKMLSIQIGSKKIEHWKIISVFLMAYDFIAVCAAYFLALWLRFDGIYSRIDNGYLNAFNSFILPCAAASIVIFFFFRMYNSMWRFASFSEFVRTVLGSLVSSILHTALIIFLALYSRSSCSSVSASPSALSRF